MTTVAHVVGARPNFMKLAPVLSALDRAGGFRSVIIHTGQHYDANMSSDFFRDLDLPEPDHHLGVGSAPPGEQTGRILVALEPVLAKVGPGLVMVVGDVNSTLAGALTASRLNIPLAHVEAGLRSFDRSMPEEVNRVLTDALADHLFTPSEDANENLLREGKAPGQIHFVGNVMIDTLLRFRDRAAALDVPGRLGLKPKSYAVVTLHRPSNVDRPAILGRVMETLEGLAAELPVLFPVHPRTLRGLPPAARLRLLDPMGYLEFLGLLQEAALAITDSGGIQEETTILGVPCLTLRANTERPVTVTHGTNRLVHPERDDILAACRKILRRPPPAKAPPPRWDGLAAARIADLLARTFGEAPERAAR